MSTVPIIIQHERTGRLCRFSPPLRGRERRVRMLSIDPAIHSWVLDSTAQPPTSRVKGAIRAHFGEFVRGELIDDLDFMKRIEDRRTNPPTFSHGVWAISPRVNPQSRFFGLFAVTDWFVGLCRKERSALTTDATWHVQIDQSLKLWSDLFPTQPPWVRDTLPEYLSNAEKCDDRW
jgi:hypothetical protein